MPEGLKKRYNEFRFRLLLEGGLSFGNFTLSTGIFLVGFALAYGADNLVIGILSAIPLFANLLQLVSAFFLEATGTKKKTAIISLFLARIIWIPVVLLALGSITGRPLLVFTIVLIIYSILTAVGNLSILSWIKDLVPTRNLSEFLGKRNTYANVAGVIIYLVGAILIDRMPGKEVYGYVFLLSIIIGVVGVGVLLKIPEKKTKIKAISVRNYFENMSMPFKDPSFRPLLHYGIVLAFAHAISAPFWAVMMIDNFKISFFVISIYYIFDTVARIAGFNVWAKIIDKYGSRPTLIVATTISSFGPLCFMFITKSYTFAIPLIFIVTGIGFAGSEVATFRALFKSAPRKHDAYYLSAFGAMTGLATAIGPIVGGFLAVTMARVGFNMVDPLRWIFFLSFVLRVLSLPLANRIQETRARSVQDVLHRMKTLRFFSFFVNIYNVASLTSKMVLIPQKQMFILQRKTAVEMKKDVKITIDLMTKVGNSLQNVSKKNIAQYQSRLDHLTKLFKQQIIKVDYAKDTMYQNIPIKVLDGMSSLDLKRRDIKKKTDQMYKDIEQMKKRLSNAYEKIK